MSFERAPTVEGFPSTTAQQRLASWYAQGMSDGIGKRLLMFDNTEAPSWELLKLNPQFEATPGFEDALRERVVRLSGLRHPSFAPARIVDDLSSQSGLTLVSAYAAGRRLSESLDRPRNATAAMRLIVQVTPALSTLHQQGRDIAHGALTIERFVLTNQGSFMLREHVLGSALEQLKLSASRLWLDLGVITGQSGIARLDQRTDVIQLGLVALSLMLGRRVDASEYPHKIGSLLDHAARTAGQRSPFVFTALRDWLERALQVHARPFASAVEASDALSRVDRDAGAEEADFELPPSNPAPVRALPASGAPLVETGVHRVRPTQMASPSLLDRPESSDRVASRSPSSNAVRASAPEPWVRVPPAESRRPTVQAPARPVGNRLFVELDEQDSAVLEGEHASSVPLGRNQGRSVDRTSALAAAAVIVAIAEAVAIGRLYVSSADAPAPIEPSIVFESLAPGSNVWVNGRPAGVTPLRLKVDANTVSVRVEDARPASVREAGPRAARPSLAGTPEATRTIAARPPSGSLRIVSPIELDVLEGGRRLGSSRTPIELAPGRRELELVNAAVGYRSRRVIDVKVGQTVSVKVTPGNGIVSINADPWAVASIDGKTVGETPLANLSVPVGEHEFLFRHPQLGEQRQKATVRAEGVTRVIANLRR